MAEDLHEIVARALMLDRSAITDDLKYNSIPEWDSVAHMALIAELEAAYDVMLDTDDIVAMSSVGTIRELLKKYDVEA
ncbi:acyl carrier protein [Sphingomonas sp. 22176]|uniref:acyl carrier protein n=1 Tax=Sphingomonas sp. 22176 TaxID=3453884 RepID=UPI003F860E53